MFASLGGQQPGTFGGFQSGAPYATAAQQPYGYSSEPQRQSSINIDDIIVALQNARNSKVEMEKHILQLKESQPKPIDLNQGNTCYMVAHKTFATGKVWQPDTPLLPNEGIARYELRRLSMMHPEVTYKISKVEWHQPVEEDDKEKTRRFEQSFTKEDAQKDVEYDDENHDDVAQNNRFVYCNYDNNNNNNKNAAGGNFGFPESY